MDLGIKGRLALVCGGSRGLGRAVAEELAREGCRLVLNARDPEALRIAADQIASDHGVDVRVAPGDLSMNGVPRRVVGDEAPDILIANAGGPASGLFGDLTLEQWDQAVRLSLLSVVRLCEAAVPAMRARGWGRVVAITSISAKQPIAGLMLSNATRAGVHGFLKTLSGEAACDGVTVNAVCPSHTRTARLDELAGAVAARRGVSSGQVFEEWAAANPTGRIGRPEELAAAAAFLCSDRASFINGVFLGVDGGAVRGLT